MIWFLALDRGRSGLEVSGSGRFGGTAYRVAMPLAISHSAWSRRRRSGRRSQQDLPAWVWAVQNKSGHGVILGEGCRASVRWVIA